MNLGLLESWLLVTFCFTAVVLSVIKVYNVNELTDFSPFWRQKNVLKSEDSVNDQDNSKPLLQRGDISKQLQLREEISKQLRLREDIIISKVNANDKSNHIHHQQPEDIVKSKKYKTIGTIASRHFENNPPKLNDFIGITLQRNGMEFKVELWGKEITIVVDSGAQVSVLTDDTFQDSMYDGADLECHRHIELLTWGDAREIDVGSIQFLPLHYSDQLSICTSFMVLPVADNLLGLGFLIETGCKQQWTSNGEVVLWFKGEGIIHCENGHNPAMGLYMNINFNGVLVEALVDTGAAASLITLGLVNQLNLNTIPPPGNTTLSDASEHNIQLYGIVPNLEIQTDEHVSWDYFNIFHHHEHIIIPRLHVISNNIDRLTLGQTFLRRYNCVIDYETKTLYIQKHTGNYIKVQLKQVQMEVAIKDAEDPI